jgi:putative endonuclease
MHDWYVYLLRCNDNSFYCGITTNIEKRLSLHQQGKGAKYVRAKGLKHLEVISGAMTRSDALKLEYQVKQARGATKKIMTLLGRANEQSKVEKNTEKSDIS